MIEPSSKIYGLLAGSKLGALMTGSVTATDTTAIATELNAVAVSLMRSL